MEGTKFIPGHSYKLNIPYIIKNYNIINLFYEWKKEQTAGFLIYPIQKCIRVKKTAYSDVFKVVFDKVIDEDGNTGFFQYDYELFIEVKTHIPKAEPVEETDFSMFDKVKL